jgi:hypothetical protein
MALSQQPNQKRGHQPAALAFHSPVLKAQKSCVRNADILNTGLETGEAIQVFTEGEPKDDENKQPIHHRSRIAANLPVNY